MSDEMERFKHTVNAQARDGDWDTTDWDNTDLVAAKHKITVKELLTILTDPRLSATDLLVPNDVENLAIIREGTYVGYVDLLEGHHVLETWTDGGTHD